MPSNQTPNYALNQWSKDDRVLMDDFNADNAKIDAAIKEVDQKADGKADTSALNALSQTVTAHTAALALRGNCKIWTAAYKGTGQSGSEHPNQLTFPEMPVFALVFEGDGDFIPLIPGGSGSVYHTASTGSERLSVSWYGNTAKWYINGSPYKQMNRQGTTYYVFAFIKAD